MRALFFSLLLLFSAAPLPSHAAFDFVQVVPVECACTGVAAEGNVEIVSSAPAYGCVLQTLQNIIRVVVSIGFILATLALMYAGFLWMTSANNPANHGKAKQLLLNIFVGITIMLTSWLIVDFVMKTIYDENGGFGPWNNILAGNGDSANYCLQARAPKALTTGALSIVSKVDSNSTTTTPEGGSSTEATSQSEVGDSQGRYTSQSEAARAALTYSNPRSIRDNLEYGGFIYRDRDGEYWWDWSGPAIGTETGVRAGDAPPPPGSQVVGTYHTHADYSMPDKKTGKIIRTSDPKKDAFNSDTFSEHDLKRAKIGLKYYTAGGGKGFRVYLGTPSGNFLYYDPETDVIGNL